MTSPIALTCGDMSGIGPEITLKAWAALSGSCPFFVIGDADYLASLGAPVARIDTPDQAAGAGPLPVLHQPLAARPRPGVAQQENAPATLASIDTAVALAQSGAARAVVTNPITKKVLVDGAGFAHPGHTEYLAALGGIARPVMMLAAPELRVVPATIHIPLSQVATALTETLLTETLEVLHAALIRDFGIPRPRIAVAGLNPHAGEGGMMGTEDDAMIRPVLEQARARGMAVTGPLPADTMFHAAARTRYDAALCMYHDQALIPLKTLNFSAGVNITLGLPFIRTSPDHGTAYDIAGKGVADADSLIAALLMADDLGERRAAAE